MKKMTSMGIQPTVSQDNRFLSVVL